MSAARNWTSATEFVEWIEPQLPRLLGLARHLTGDEQEAQDVMQDVLERAWRARDQLRDPAAGGAWLRTILTRRVIDRRRGTRELALGDDERLETLLVDFDDPAALERAAEDDARVRAALRRLSEPDRIALVLHDGAGWTAAEIATILRTGQEATYKRIQRARGRLLVALAGDEIPRRPPRDACRAARAHAHELLDGRLDATQRAAVESHLSTCEACPATLQAAAAVLRRLASAAADEPPAPALTERLRALVADAG